MKIDCVFCKAEINLSHEIFYDYDGSVKCFCCGAIMDVCTKRGVLEVAHLVEKSPHHSLADSLEHGL